MRVPRFTGPEVLISVFEFWKNKISRDDGSETHPLLSNGIKKLEPLLDEPKPPQQSLSPFLLHVNRPLRSRAPYFVRTGARANEQLPSAHFGFVGIVLPAPCDDMSSGIIVLNPYEHSPQRNSPTALSSSDSTKLSVLLCVKISIGPSTN